MGNDKIEGLRLGVETPMNLLMMSDTLELSPFHDSQIMCMLVAHTGRGIAIEAC